MPLANEDLPNPLDPSLSTQERTGVAYSDGPQLVNNYAVVEGVMILPVAESPPETESELLAWSPVVKIRLHSPYRIRTARYSAAKQSGVPVMPGPGDTGAFIFLGGTIQFSNYYVSDGVYNWDTRSVYQYVENCVSRNVDGFVLGTPPWTWPASEGLFSVLGGVIGGAGGSPSVPSPGAVAYAGSNAKLGWYSQDAMGPDEYNFPSYYPGHFFNDGLMNASPSDNSGGTPPMQPVP